MRPGCFWRLRRFILTGIISPPSLMDDVDAVQAQIARNMLTSGDWVTARLDGVVYFEKSPLIYWLIAITYKLSACTTGRRASPSHSPRSGWRG
jgi:4-amino-4-deoxy-L-arabinose transferase-like glycosyltransferase